jgi:hypothetical protein
MHAAGMKMPEGDGETVLKSKLRGRLRLPALIKNRLGGVQEAIEHIHTAIALNPFYLEYPWNLAGPLQLKV